MKALSLFSLAAMLATVALPSEGRVLVSAVEPTAQAGTVLVEVTHLNASGAAEEGRFPERLAATLEVAGRRLAVELVRAAGSPEAATVPPGQFAQARYTLALPAGAATGATALLRLQGTQEAAAAPPALAFTVPAATALAAREEAPGETRAAAATAAPSPAPTLVPTLAAGPDPRPTADNRYIGNLSSYAPIYAVYGPGTNTEIRIQLSFKYQLFGDPGAVGPGHSLLNGIHLGYTQRMFWDWSARSSPFRNIDFMPELFYLIPAQQVADGLALGGQFGIRHASNGRDGADSRSINTLYVQPVATARLGGGRHLSVGPLFEVYVGSLEDNPDIKRYRGNTGLFLEVGDEDGVRLSTNTRFSVQSGRGSIDAELSFPFDRIIDSSLNLYLFGQAFTGYGENLLDYDRRDTRFRIGVAIVR